MNYILGRNLHSSQASRSFIVRRIPLTFDDNSASIDSIARDIIENEPVTKR